jgi:adenylate cyclase
VVAVEEDPADTFDPRTRPWYNGASAADGLFWADVYVFFTTQEPGLTVSHAIRGEGGELFGVAGGDITRAELSGFLADLELGANRRALIVDGAGRLVAFPDPARIVERSGDDYRPAQMATLGDPILTEAYDRMRLRAGQSAASRPCRPYIGPPVGRLS